MDQHNPSSTEVTSDAEARTAATLHEKLADALIPGFQAEFAPDEAEQAGAFAEDALSEQDAVDSDVDLADANTPAAGDDKE